MANKEKMLYTQEGYNELEKELKYLRVTRREEIKEAIAVARGFGDLSENSEYDEARNEQAKVEARQNKLRSASLVRDGAQFINLDPKRLSDSIERANKQLVTQCSTHGQ